MAAPDVQRCECEQCEDSRSVEFWRLLVDHSDVEADALAEDHRTAHDERGEVR